MNTDNTQISSTRPAVEDQDTPSTGRDRRWRVVIHDDGCTETFEATTSKLADGEIAGPFIYLRPWRHEAWEVEVTAPDWQTADDMACDIADTRIFI